MQKTLKITLVLIFAALGVFALSTRAKTDFHAGNSFVKENKENDAIAEDADTTAPKDLFVSNCARCHGVDGAGQTELGEKLDVPDLSISGRRMSAKKITRIVTNGKEEMPAFGKKLSKSQIASLAAYVREL